MIKTKRLADGRWRAWGHRAGRRFDGEGKTKRVAEQRVVDKMAAAETDPTSGKVASDVRVEAYVERSLAKLPNQDTAKRRRASWKRHGGALNSMRVRDITVPIVAGWRDQLAQDHRTRDVEVARAVLRSALDDAVEAGLLAQNPARGLRRTRRAKSRDAKDAQVYRTYTRDELRRLKSAARAERLGGIVVLMADTGLRTGEALGLDWSAIKGDRLTVRQQLVEDQGKQRLSSELKTANSARTIFVADETLQALGPRRSGLVFESVSGGPVWRRAVRSMWKRVHSVTGIEPDGRTLYNLRHSHITALVEAGTPVTAVAARVGDEPETVLKFYARARSDDAAVDAVKDLAAT